MNDEELYDTERYGSLVRQYRYAQMALNRRLLELAYPDADTNLIERLLERAIPEDCGEPDMKLVDGLLGKTFPREGRVTAMGDFFDAHPEWRD